MTESDQHKMGPWYWSNGHFACLHAEDPSSNPVEVGILLNCLEKNVNKHKNMPEMAHFFKTAAKMAWTMHT